LGGDVIHSGRNDTLVSAGLPDHIMAVYRLCWAEGSFEIGTPTPIAFPNCRVILLIDIYRTLKICADLIDIANQVQYNISLNDEQEKEGSMDTLNEKIARKAFELYEQRGWQHGHDLDDWLKAERLIFGEMKSQITNITNTARRRKPSPESSGFKSV